MKMAKFIGNPDEVRNLSNELRSLYNEALIEAEEIVDCSDELPLGWEGEASIAYYHQFIALLQLVRGAVNSFEEICKSLDNVATSLEEGEKNTWQE